VVELVLLVAFSIKPAAPSQGASQLEEQSRAGVGAENGHPTPETGAMRTAPCPRRHYHPDDIIIDINQVLCYRKHTSIWRKWYQI